MMEWLASLENSGFGTWLREFPSLWAYLAVLTLHTVGLGVLVGGNAVIDLGLLGWGKAIPLAPLGRLYPVMWIGFWVNTIYLGAHAPVYWQRLSGLSPWPSQHC
jgi:hypothetical protein